MVIKLVLKDGTELISKQVRQETITDGLIKPYYQLTVNLRQGNELTVDQLEAALTKENLESIKIYRRDYAFDQSTGEETYGEFEFEDEIKGFTILKGIFKDFYSKEISVVIKKDQ